VQRYPDASTANDRLDAGGRAAASTEGRAPIDPDATAAGSDFSGDATRGGRGSEGGGESGSDEGDGEDGEDQAPIYQGPTRWHRLYHHEAGGERYGFGEHAGVQYGYVVQAGEFVVAAGFGGDAWEERTGWQGQLANGWAVV